METEGKPSNETKRLFLDGTADLMLALKSPTGIKLVLEYKGNFDSVVFCYGSLVAYFTGLMEGLSKMTDPPEAIPILLNLIEKINGKVEKQASLVQSIQTALVELSETKVHSLTAHFAPPSFFLCSFSRIVLLGFRDPLWHRAESPDV